MERHERTVWGFVVALVVAGLLGVSLTLPWWTYTFSTGPQTIPGGPQPTDDARIERERLDVYPYRTEGHSNNTTAADVADRVQLLGNLVVASLATAGLIALLEMPVPFPVSTRRVTLVLGVVGPVLALAALVYAWFWIPELLATAQVDRPYTTRELPDGFHQTWLNWGWAVCFVAALVYPAVFAFKFQAGATDPTVIETFRTNPPP
ncbi:MAG: hypothetical protein HYT80_08150 [Euryarchaeota archaeon]|nr:hypothetical protein [Euryarchaeota archaeon]